MTAPIRAHEDPIASQLKPVLRGHDFEAFDLGAVFQQVAKVASLLA